MPFLNRFVGNPALTGMLNLLFGVKVSDAHCGMRAVRREATGPPSHRSFSMRASAWSARRSRPSSRTRISQTPSPGSERRISCSTSTAGCVQP